MRTSRIAAELSSDLRVPLTSMIADLAVLDEELGENPDPVIASLLARTVKAAARMERMLDQHMDVDRGRRPDSGRG